MVLTFNSIPLHIQKNIVEKMNFNDFKNFITSSNDVKNLENMVKVTMDVEDMSFRSGRGLSFHYYGPFLYYWSTLKSHSNCPRICAKRIEISGELFDAVDLEEVVLDAEAGYFCGKKMSCNFWSPTITMGPDLFCRFLKAFNITDFVDEISTRTEQDLYYLKCLQSSQLEEISLRTPFPVEEFLKLKAPILRFYTNSDKINGSVNVLLKEWYFQQRSIINVKLYKPEGAVREDFSIEEIFSGLSYSVLWTPEIHESTMLFSKLSLEEDMSSWKEDRYYLLEKDSNKLVVLLCEGNVITWESSNPEEDLIVQLDPCSYQKQTGICQYCSNEICSPTGSETCMGFEAYLRLIEPYDDSDYEDDDDDDG